MKLRLLAATLAAVVLSSSTVLAQSAKPAPAASAPAASDKTTLSYAIGYDMARDLAERKVDLDMTTLIRGIQEGYAKKAPTMPGEKLAAAPRQSRACIGQFGQLEHPPADGLTLHPRHRVAVACRGAGG